MKLRYRSPGYPPARSSLSVVMLVAAAVQVALLVALLAPHDWAAVSAADAASPQSNVTVAPSPRPNPQTGLPNDLDDEAPKTPINLDLGWQSWNNLPTDLKDKVDPRIIAELQGEVLPAHMAVSIDSSLRVPDPIQPPEKTRFLVYLRQETDLAPLAERVYASAVARRTAVLDTLVTAAQVSQSGLRSELEVQAAAGHVNSYQSFFIVNALAVEGDIFTLLELARRPDVKRIAANYPLIPLWDSAGDIGQGAPLASSSFGMPDGKGHSAEAAAIGVPRAQTQLSTDNWNIDLVNADDVWRELGIRGEGAVVAGFDTGVNYAHPGLVNQYRGTLPTGGVDHNYNWFEPDSRLYPNGNLGQSVSNQPNDCAFFSTHGTHTMGTMVGDGNAAEGTQVGVAPGARWIALPGICGATMPGGLGDDIGGLKAFQWLLCPTDLTGDLATADCSKAPDVVNNSWGSANPVDETFRPAIQVLRAAGIAPVFAAGNPSARAGSIGAPANAPEAITVGATDSEDKIAYFSGRGPSFYAGEQKPELSAPGVEVRSTVGTSDYYEYSGTSMAAPHVAGLIALMVSADLADGIRDFNVDELELFMQQTAHDIGEIGPDNLHGFGRINAFNAVNLVLTAGDLRGTVRDAASRAPLTNAVVTGIRRNDTLRLTSQTDSSGNYSMTVPAGTYDIQVASWGYYTGTFMGQSVFGGALAIGDFALQPQPMTQVSGFVRTVGGAQNGVAVGSAQIAVDGHPTISTTARADGFYTLSLPAGEHLLIVKAKGHRVLHQKVVAQATVASTTQNFALAQQPTILLVEADAGYGWFSGWPVRPIFEWALDQHDYTYDFWRLQYQHITDTETMTDGTVLVGVPSTETLSAYDVVVWYHSGCAGYGCYQGGSPKDVGAEDELIGFLEQGGRLILSGQDIGSWDRGDALFQDYLHADLVNGRAASEGETLSGLDFLDGINLEVTNASLRGHPNGTTLLSPDAVTSAPLPVDEEDDGDSDGGGSADARDLTTTGSITADSRLARSGATYPILQYDNGNGAAAMAVDPCGADYRAVYLAMGYENIGPRADVRDPAIAAVLDQSLTWLGQSKPALAIGVVASNSAQAGQPGETIKYQLQIINKGANPATVRLTIEGANWPIHLFDANASSETDPELSSPFLLEPCALREVVAVVDVPATVANGARDVATVKAVVDGASSATSAVDLTSQAFDAWQVEEAMPTSRYRLRAVALPNDIHVYALGGWFNPGQAGTGFDDASTATERFNVCTRSWETMATLPQPLANLGAAVLNGKIYAVGGASVSYFTSLQYWDTLYVYDPAVNSWSSAASMPVKISGLAAAGMNGKLYVFGGYDGVDESAKTFMYDPVADRWSERAPMPGGSRSFATATAFNNRIYVVGGWPNLRSVEIYDPNTDTWTEGPPVKLGRQWPGLAVGADGYLYLTGGGSAWSGVNQVERLTPNGSRWEVVSALNSRSRAGTAAAYAAGHVLAVGGAAESTDPRDTESLQITSSFCASTITTDSTGYQPGNPIRYVVSLSADPAPITLAEVKAAIPMSTTFVAFDSNRVGAVYNAEENVVQWSGNIAANGAPVTFTYHVQMADIEWNSGDVITTTANFAAHWANSSTVAFTRTLLSPIFTPDFVASSMQAYPTMALSGEPVTYTVRVESTSFAGGAATMRSPLPADLLYLPNSLTSTMGTATYDDKTRVIRWAGDVTAGDDAFVNNKHTYVWGDSDQQGDVPKVAFDWIDVRAAGERLLQGDDVYECDFEIGFDFPFFGNQETTFCVSTNGFVSFDTLGSFDRSSNCPLPSTLGNEAVIAAVWDDLVVDDGIYAQTLGTAPNRYLVVQWSRARQFSFVGTREPGDFQVILYENGAVKVQILKAGDNDGSFSVTGLEDYTASEGVTYACGEAGSLRDEQGIIFLPPGASYGSARATIAFQAQAAPSTPVNRVITSTAQITTANDAFTRTVAVTFNPVDLGDSYAEVNVVQANVGEQVDYRFVLQNRGLLTATNAIFTSTIPTSTGLVAGSLACTIGDCTVQNNATGGQAVRWQGVLAPDAPVTVTFATELTHLLPDRTPVNVRATLNDGYGNQYPLTTFFIARSPDLSTSFLRVIPSFIDPGEPILYEFYMRNTGNMATDAELEIPLPGALRFTNGSLVCGSGSCTFDAAGITSSGTHAAGGVVRWAGTVPPRGSVLLRFGVQTPAEAQYGDLFVYEARLTDMMWQKDYMLEAEVMVARAIYLPWIGTPIKLYLPVVARE